MTRLAALTHLEVQAKLRAGAVALWPTGSTEAHGPHLPLETDVVISRTSADRAVDAIRTRTGLEALVLPPLAFTITDFASPFSGTVSIPAATAEAYVRDVVLGVARQGFKAVVLVNAHLEPAHRFAMRNAVKAAAAESPCPVAIADPCDRRWVPRMTPEFQSGDCHAGQYETSLVLAAEPTLVKEEVRKDLPAFQGDLVGSMQKGLKTFPEMGAVDGYFGFPADASVAEGNETYAVLADIVSTVVAECLAPSEGD